MFRNLMFATMFGIATTIGLATLKAEPPAGTVPSTFAALDTSSGSAEVEQVAQRRNRRGDRDWDRGRNRYRYRYRPQPVYRYYYDPYYYSYPGSYYYPGHYDPWYGGYYDGSVRVGPVRIWW